LKSFRLYLTYEVLAPTKVVDDYQPEELERFRAAFHPLAQRYRHRIRCIGYPIAATAVVCWLLAIVFPRFLPWCVPGFMVSILALILLTCVSPLPKCPACHNALDHGLGEFCPECGSRGLDRVGWLHARQCASCEKRLTRRKARHYKIRACTQCGVFLDEKGL
jgi:hypothetical protein